MIYSMTLKHKVTILRNSKTVAIHQQRSQTKRDEAVAAYEAYRQRIRLNPNHAADELMDEDINRLVHELR